jgi:hypothetical protein
MSQHRNKYITKQTTKNEVDDPSECYSPKECRSSSGNKNLRIIDLQFFSDPTSTFSRDGKSYQKA